MVSAGPQAPFRQLADQIDLTCGELRVQGLPETRFGKIPLLFGHGPLVVRRERDGRTLLYGNECLPCKHRSGANYVASGYAINPLGLEFLEKPFHTLLIVLKG